MDNLNTPTRVLDENCSQFVEEHMMQKETISASLTALVRDQNDEDVEGIFRIGDLAREFNVTLRTLRFYEDRKLLVPARSGSTRLYSAADRQRLKLILLAKRVGFSLAEIEEILKVEDKGLMSDECIEKLIAKFRGQIPVLVAQKEEVDQALREVDETIAFLETQRQE